MKTALTVPPLISKNRNFAFLWLGQVVSSAGDWMANIILPLYVLNITHSTVSVGILMAFRVLPVIIVGPFVGGLADHFSKRKVMMSADAVRGLLFIAMPFAKSTWQIYGLTIIVTIASTVFTPTLKAYIPEIVKEEETVLANSALGFGQQAMMSLGPVIGGLLASILGHKIAFYVNAGSYFVSLLALTSASGVKKLGSRARDEQEAGEEANYLRAVRESMIYLRKASDILTVIITFSVACLGYGMFNVLFPLMASSKWHSIGNAYGLIMSFLGSGLALGSVLGGFIKIRNNLYLLFGLIMAISGLAFIFFGTARLFPEALLAILAVGSFDGINDVVNATLLQTRVDRAYQGRVFAFQEASTSAPLLLGMIIAGYLAQRFSLMGIAVLAGGLILTSGVVHCVFTGLLPRFFFGARASYPLGKRRTGS